MFGALDISTSGLVAQRTRIDVISANLANINSVEGPDGEYEPYRRRVPIFATGDPTTGSIEGVHVQEVHLDMSELVSRYEPGHKFADDEGYVYYPNIDSTTEVINAMEASRAYEANITAVEVTKSMMNAALQILA